MDFSYTPEQEAFRAELRGWLDARRQARAIPQGASTDLDEFVSNGRRWQRELHEGGWCGVHWPVEYGGRGTGLIEQIIFQEELARAASPQLVNLLALSMVGPLLIEHGSRAHKERYLKKILTAEEIWCQGFSEPGAGSDLASVSTRAVADGDTYRVSGQKVWTSFAQYADFCLLLVRTDTQAAKHQGLSMLIVDMRSQGVQTKPLRQMNGDSEFNEVFFDGVSVPRRNLVGEENQGWSMALAMLMYERATLTFQRQLQSRVALEDLLHFAREFAPGGKTAASDPLLRQRLAWAYTESEALRLTSLRHLTKQLKGSPPGPEGSMDKLFWSEMFQRMLEVAMSVAGPYSQLAAGDPHAPMQGHWPHMYLYSRGRTIAAGSSEIQRGIIAQRVLGLPKDR
ncbi:MAG: acyl-CoA dehydrogenase family protein [Deltaproteobacteria bacterium]